MCPKLVIGIAARMLVSVLYDQVPGSRRALVIALFLANRPTGLGAREIVMWKAVLVGAAAIVIAGPSMVFAQQMERSGEGSQPPRVAQEDRTESTDGALASRLASLKERLRLTPEQEKNWTAYDAALRALAKHRRDRMQASHEQERSTDPTQRLRQRAEGLSGVGAALSRLADAQEPLYNSLDEGQKRQFATLPQILRGRGSDMDRRSRDGDEDRDRRGARGRGDDDDRRTARGRGDDDDRRAARGRGDDDDRRAARGRGDDDDRRGARGRGDDDDRRGARGRGDDDDRRAWRGRGDDDDRSAWRGRGDDDRRAWRGRGNDDRRGWRGRGDDDNRRGSRDCLTL
jgi:hypothetical protein